MLKSKVLAVARKHPVLVESVRQTLFGAGAFGALLAGLVLCMLGSTTEFRSAVFYSRPVQSLFAEQLNLLQPAQALAAGDSSVKTPRSKAGVAKSPGIWVPVRLSSADRAMALTPGQKGVAAYLARRYRVSLEAIESLVRVAWKVGKQEKVEPTLILAISGIESSYNPLAASSVGAKGLMQVMAHIHKDRFEQLADGDWTPLNPELNMQVGANIVREYTRRTGSVREALVWYVGAAVHGNHGGYPDKVLGLKDKIDQAYRSAALVAGQGKAAADKA
ncbi:MAG: lytic transglycosylase domain-containing protein [Limnobacter sp.]|nr:lytic transglycosylase domain-containing protein [Limnobacter sp.]